MTPPAAPPDDAVNGSYADAATPCLVIDIDDHVTRLRAVLRSWSSTADIDVGTARLTTSHLLHDPPRADDLSNAIGYVTDLLEDAQRDLPSLAPPLHVLGVGTAITTIAAVELGLDTSDPARLDGTRLARPAIEEVFRTLATESLADRLHNPGLPEAQAASIVGGCCILVAIMRRWRLDDLVVASSESLDYGTNGP